MTARVYQPVLAEITTALFACPDCGAVVWHALCGEHDSWHTLGDDQDHQIAESLDEHASQIVRLQQQAGDLESTTYRLDDAVRDVGYRADDAQRTAERAADAASSASRGW